MPSVWGLFTMPTEVSGKKYANARNGQEILWNTIIFLAPGKWLEGCQKISAAIRSLWLILEEYARLNFASKKSGTPASGHHVKHINSLCRTSEWWAGLMMRRTMVSQTTRCWYKNYDGEGKLSGHRSWAKMILESSCGTGCAACHDKYNLHNTLMRKDYDIGFVSLFAK